MKDNYTDLPLRWRPDAEPNPQLVALYGVYAGLDTTASGYYERRRRNIALRWTVIVWDAAYQAYWRRGWLARLRDWVEDQAWRGLGAWRRVV